MNLKSEYEEMCNEVCIDCKHLMKCSEELKKVCAFRKAAEVLYDKGYRKQKEGKWVDTGVCDFECSVCRNLNDYENSYCPHCGATMEGE